MLSSAGFIWMADSAVLFLSFRCLLGQPQLAFSAFPERNRFFLTLLVFHHRLLLFGGCTLVVSHVVKFTFPQ